MTLGQENLFLPSPTRRLIVRPGATAWWGVDSSTKRVAIGMVDAAGARSGAVASLPTLPGAHRLAAIYESTYSLACELRRSLMPGVVVIEEAAGFGKRPNPELAYAVGAVLTAVARALPETCIERVAGSKWKLAVCGFGGIKKPKPTSREPYAVLEWARGVGYAGGLWDEADAWAIAEYGRRTFGLEERS